MSSLFRSFATAISSAALLLSFITVPLEGDNRIVPEGAAFEELWNEGEFTEGVAAAPDGTIYFSDIPSKDNVGRVLKFDPAAGKTSVLCADSGKSNGLMFDADGRLIACCGANDGLRALCEITEAGEIRVLVDRYKEKRLNSPNDLVIHPDGSIYFSDPRYVGAEPLELDHQSLYRFLPATGRLQRLRAAIVKPNGVILSPDGKTLYVADTDNGTVDPDQPPAPDVKPRSVLNRFVVNDDGTLGEKTTIVDFGDQNGIDGMTMDMDGHVYAAVRSKARHGIAIYTPDGEEVAFLPTEDLPTNCCFGRGDEASVLYATIGGGLYRIQLTSTGYHLPTAK
jgi:gluconolactonase